MGVRERDEVCEEALREARTRWETEVEELVSRRLEEGRQQERSISCAIRNF